MRGERASRQKILTWNSASNWMAGRVSQSTRAQLGSPAISRQVSSRSRTVMKPIRVRVKSSEWARALQNSDSFSIQSLHLRTEGSFYTVPILMHQPPSPL